MTPYKKYLLIIRALEDKHTAKIYKATYIYYSSFFTDLQTNGIDTAKSNLTLITASNDLITTLQDIYKGAGIRGARLTYNELRASLRTEQKAGGFGRNERWLRSVLDYLKINILQFANLITETVREDILKIVSKGVDEGLGIEAIVKLLRTTPIPQARARVIARTEIVRAANIGHAIGAREFPFEMNKKWSAARDHRVRHSHKSVHNQMVDENSYFDVPVYKGKLRLGTEQMSQPGDPKASASNTVNCRCRIVHEAKRDAQGNLIRRSTSAIVIPLRSTFQEQLPNIGIAAMRKAFAAAITIGVEDSE